MSNVFIVYLFYFQINKHITIFCCIESTFTSMPEYNKHMILNTLQVFYIYNKHNLNHISIFYNISIFSFLSLCVSKCVAWKIFHIFISESVGYNMDKLNVCMKPIYFPANTQRFHNNAGKLRWTPGAELFWDKRCNNLVATFDQIYFVWQWKLLISNVVATLQQCYLAL